MVECGVLTQSAKTPVEKRLQIFFVELRNIILQYRPDEVAIEEPYVAKNARSALAIGRSQAIAILAATDKNVPVFRYLPAQVKQQVTNYGGSSKEQVQGMVKIQLGLSDLPDSTDAADALAHRRGERPFDGHLVGPDLFEGFIREPLTVHIEGLFTRENFKPRDPAIFAIRGLYRRVEGDLRGPPDVRAGAVAFDEGDDGVVGYDGFAIVVDGDFFAVG